MVVFRNLEKVVVNINGNVWVFLEEIRRRNKEVEVSGRVGMDMFCKVRRFVIWLYFIGGFRDYIIY